MHGPGSGHEGVFWVAPTSATTQFSHAIVRKREGSGDKSRALKLLCFQHSPRRWTSTIKTDWGERGSGFPQPTSTAQNKTNLSIRHPAACSVHPTHDGQDGPPLGFFACPPHFVVRGTATPGPERRSPGHLPPSSPPPPPQGHPQARPSRRPLRTLNAPDTSSLGPAPAPRILHRRRPLWATRSRCHVRLCRSCISPKPVPVLVSVRRTRPGPLLTLTT